MTEPHPRFTPPCERCNHGELSCKKDPRCQRETEAYRIAFDEWIEVKIKPWAALENARLRLRPAPPCL